MEKTPSIKGFDPEKFIPLRSTKISKIIETREGIYAIVRRFENGIDFVYWGFGDIRETILSAYKIPEVQVYSQRYAIPIPFLHLYPMVEWGKEHLDDFRKNYPTRDARLNPSTTTE